MNIIVMGVQGSGKGTQAERICEKYNLNHITTGEIFRYHLKMQTDLGREAQGYINRGELVPDELVFKIVEDELTKSTQGFLLDGFPRTIAQAEYLMKRFVIDRVFFLDLPDSLAIARIEGRRICINCGSNYNLLSQKPKVAGFCDNCGGELMQRSDDYPEAVKIRIQKFHEETDVLTDFFEGTGKLHKINANQPVEVIFQKICDLM